jgi:N utilization substance protein B
MGIRRQAREAAFQFLFQEDFVAREDVDPESLEERFALFCGLFQVSRKGRSYALELLRVYLANTERVNELIKQATTNWRLTRIAATDRNILRLAICELVFVNDIPDEVAIDEAVEIAKRFGGDDSPSFINGVLDAVRKILRG